MVSISGVFSRYNFILNVTISILLPQHNFYKVSSLHLSKGLFGAEVKSSIVGGKDAVKDRWPWMVHINITTSDGHDNWRCGGSILSDQWVLTAASCWDE